MRSLAASLLVLALYSDLAIATRSSSSSLLGKGKPVEFEGAHCICVVKKVAVLEERRLFDSESDCHAKCTRACHQNRKHRIHHRDATVIGIKPDSVPVMASKCDADGSCSCWDPKEAKKKTNQHWNDLKGTPRVLTQQLFNTSSQCSSQCECDDEKYESLCMHVWEEEWNLYDGNKLCDFPRVGLSNCIYDQRFNLIKEKKGYRVRLARLRRSDEIVKLDVDVGRFEVKKKHLLHATLGLKGEKTEWTLRKTSKWYNTEFEWEVVNQHGQVNFTIFTDRGCWKVNRWKGTGEPHLYYVFNDRPGVLDEGFDLGEALLGGAFGPSGYSYTLYSDKTKRSKVGTLQDTGGDDDDEESKFPRFLVDVKEGQKAGLVLMTSLVIRKANR